MGRGDGVGGRWLLVANAGGHLAQLHRLAGRLPLVGHPVWVTNVSAQSRSLLAGEDVIWVPEVAPRDGRNLVRCLVRSLPMTRHRPAAAVSTGSGIALGFLPVLASVGVSCHYIESATRAEGPSLTGRVMRYHPGVRLYTQHPSWAGRRWHYAGSVFEGFEGRPRQDPPSVIRRAVVTVGTLNYPFERMLRAARAVLPADADVLWQVGPARFDPLAGVGRAAVPADELVAAMRQADVVIAHAGTGSALTAMELGKCPVLIPREHSNAEHIDDHQSQTAAFLAGLEIAVSRRVDELCPADLLVAAGREVVTAADAPRLELRSR